MTQSFTTKTGDRHLKVNLPKPAAFIWIGKLVRLTWLPFTTAIGGRWLTSVLDVISSSLLAYTLVQFGGNQKTNLPIPQFILDRISDASSPLITALLFALGVILISLAIHAVVEWCLTWTHLKVNRTLTPDVMEAAIEPATKRLIDPPTAVQRWLLKIDISYFLYESLASTIGHLGTIIIILFATFRASLIAGQIALASLALWIVAAVPMMIKALRASQHAAYIHEAVGRTIRDSASLRTELARPSLRAYWLKRNQPQLKGLNSAIKRQGIWNVSLFTVLELIASSMPIVAVIATVSTSPNASALAVLLYLTRMSSPLKSLANTLPWIQQNLISVQRVFQLLEYERDRMISIPKNYNPIHKIQVSNWNVTLPDGSKIFYPDFHLSKKHIQCVVGPSGSGKSLLLGSLAGQIEARELLDIDGDKVSPTDPRWRETCILVQQEPELVPGTICDNLHDFPGWTETPSLAEALNLILSSRVAGSQGEVAIDQKGVSVGQRRAIAVLRALGSDASVLFLDEPIAGVDDALIRPLANAIGEACQNGKIILIAMHKHDIDRLRLSQSRTLVLPSRQESKTRAV